MAVLRIALAAVLACAGCGLNLTDERSGGAENLPTAGAGPYARLPLDFDSPINEPYVIEDRRHSYLDPSALPRAGGGYRLWFTALAVDDDPATTGRIDAAELASVRELPVVGPSPVLTADQAWERGRVAAPTVLEVDGALVMFYEGGPEGETSIGRADSADGTAWVKHPDNPVLPGAANPSAIHHEGDWQLYVTIPGTEGIFRVDGTDGVRWPSAPAPVIQPRPNLAEAFDRVSVGDPGAVVRITSAGRPVYGLFFTGLEGTAEAADVQVGYAGSFDAVHWERFMGADPVLRAAELPIRGPSVVLEPTGGVMFFHEIGAGRGKIGVALHP